MPYFISIKEKDAKVTISIEQPEVQNKKEAIEIIKDVISRL